MTRMKQWIQRIMVQSWQAVDRMISSYVFIAGWGLCLVVFLGFTPYLPSWFQWPWISSGLFEDFVETPEGEIYIATTVGARIARYDKTGRFIASYRDPIGTRPAELAVSADGRLYIAHGLNVVACSPDMETLRSYSPPPNTFGSWRLGDDGALIFGERAFRVHRTALPGDVLVGRDDDSGERQGFHALDGSVLARPPFIGGLVRKQQGTIVARYESPWFLRLFAYPFHAAPLLFLVRIVGWLLTKYEESLVNGVSLCCDRTVSFLVYPFLHTTILCNHCLRVTHPFRSRYQEGVRFCEHCHHEVERTKLPGKVLVVFGDVPLTINGQRYEFHDARGIIKKLPHRVFVFVNPELKKDQGRPIEISEVYIDPVTCDRHALERFLTYLLNYPPKCGVQSIRIYYKGRLHELGTPLKNTLLNHFPHIRQLA